MSQRNIIVTGATSGIGAATVRQLCAGRDRVLAIGRRADRLSELAAETGCDTLTGDVRDHRALHDRILTFAPDGLVNNAGAGHGIDGLETAPPETIQLAIDTNVTALLHLSALVLPGMRARGRGHIVNIGSIAGLHNGVSAIYGGTKAAVHMISQNLRMELRGTPIRVSEICPGRVSTEFYQAAQGQRETLDQMGKTGITELRAQDVADAIAYALNAPAHVNISTIELLPTEQVVGGTNVVSDRS
ncbi:SDR family oxidoreductase [Oceaniglobus ichthyenteri]|uniref:SDR family oxidoreductase n=1 Tax=Oceaniglobus ichthyenteri TaxID=2136177 RepID=UPI0013DD919E|nr:SDR family oxidoreductase [Oceaniglobus ichthyenteri]